LQERGEVPDVLLFPTFVNGFKGVANSKKHSLKMVRQWLVTWFDNAANPMLESEHFKEEVPFFRDLVPHSIRRAGVQWASECLAQEWQCVVSGRWGLNSISFRLYIQDGAVRREDFVTRRVENPMFKLWVWKFGVVETTTRTQVNAPRMRPRKRSRVRPQ
jgi:hypothetical protein